MSEFLPNIVFFVLGWIGGMMWMIDAETRRLRKHLKGEIVNPTVHEYAPEPKPDFDEMQRTVTEKGNG